MPKKTTDRSPWSVDAATGATGQVFEIRTVADFLKVPEARRRICLREFHAWLHIGQATVDLFEVVGQSLGYESIRDAIAPQYDVFRWHDDGEATVSVQIQTTSADLGTDTSRNG